MTFAYSLHPAGCCFFLLISYSLSPLCQETLEEAKKPVRGRLRHCTTLFTASRMIKEEDGRLGCFTCWSRSDITVRLVGVGRRTTRGASTRRTTQVSHMAVAETKEEEIPDIRNGHLINNYHWKSDGFWQVFHGSACIFSAFSSGAPNLSSRLCPDEALL